VTTYDDRGPNVGLSDLVIPIRRDPEFITWTNPIPPEWFSATAASYTLIDRQALYGSLVFARSYGRNGSETLPGITDTATRGLVGFNRSGEEITDVPGESVVTTRAFFRSGVEVLDPPVDTAQRISQFGGMVNPIPDTFP
jgi:hypothetical protein